MLYAPIRTLDAVDHECSRCAQVQRAPATHLPINWLILIADAKRSQAVLCGDCAPAAKSDALADIDQQTRAIVRGVCPVTDEATFSRPNVDLSADLGAGAIDQVAIVIECEELFGIHISDDDVSRIDTIGDLNSAIFDKLHMCGGSAAL